MELIDDEGNLFGLVNVVDALVVLLVLAVVAAGTAFVLTDSPDSESEPERSATYATIDLGTQPAYITDAINEGDTYSPDDTSQLTITDVHVTPRDGGIGVLLRVELEGQTTETGLTYANAPPRLGRSLDITTDLYEVSGQIRDIGDTDTLDRAEPTVVLQDILTAEEASSITAGDEIRLGGRRVAAVEDVAVYATAHPEQRRVFVEASLEAYRQQGDLRFGGTPLRRGQALTLSTSAYTIDGTVDQVGSAQLGATETRTVTLRMDEVHEEMADAIQPGMTEQVGEDTVARVTDVKTEPSLIIATGEDGTVNVVDHPVDRDVTLTTELRVRETASGLQFKRESLRQGSTVVLDLGTVTVEATVVRVGQ